MTRIDDKSYKQRVFLNYLAHPFTLFPLVGGASAIMGGWALDQPTVIFAGLAAGLIGVGAFFSRLLSENDTTEKKVLQKIEKENATEREQELVRLEQNLVADGDPRTEQAFRDLHVLAGLFRDQTTWSQGIDAQSEFNIVSGVERLYEHSLRHLKQSLDLQERSRGASTAVRSSLMGQREKLLIEVQASVARLRHLLEELGSMTPVDRSQEDLAAIREELDSSLEIAKKTNEELGRWEAPVYESEF